MSSDLYPDTAGHEWLNEPDDRSGEDRCGRCRRTWDEVTNGRMLIAADCDGPGPRTIEPRDPSGRTDWFREQTRMPPFGKFKDFTGLEPSGPAEPLPRRQPNPPRYPSGSPFSEPVAQTPQSLAMAVRESRRRYLLAKRTDEQPLLAFEPPAYPHDCGLDLALAEDVVIRRGATANVPTGVAVALPPDTFGWITGRSSTWARHGLIVMPGILDETWRGELRVLMFRPMTIDATQTEDLHLPKGTRLAQLIVLPNLLEQVTVTTLPRELSLPEGERGEQGFGSSGS